MAFPIEPRDEEDFRRSGPSVGFLVADEINTALTEGRAERYSSEESDKAADGAGLFIGIFPVPHFISVALGYVTKALFRSIAHNVPKGFINALILLAAALSPLIIISVWSELSFAFWQSAHFVAEQVESAWQQIVLLLTQDQHR